MNRMPRWGPLNNRIRGTVSLSHEGNEGTNPTRYDVHQTYLHSSSRWNVTERASNCGAGGIRGLDPRKASPRTTRRPSSAPASGRQDYAISATKHNIKLQGYYQKLKADFSDNTYGKQRADVSYSSAELQYSAAAYSTTIWPPSAPRCFRSPWTPTP
jgi:hypothetical protein